MIYIYVCMIESTSDGISILGSTITTLTLKSLACRRVDFSCVARRDNFKRLIDRHGDKTRR
jgi:hypothetical protein